MNTFIQIKDSIVDFLIYLKPTGAEQYLMSIGAVIGLVFSVAIGGMDSMIYALIALCMLTILPACSPHLKLDNGTAAQASAVFSKSLLFLL